MLCRAPPGVFLPPSAWAWIDPGVFALIGAGAFMGGVTRLTVALAVIMMEARRFAAQIARPLTSVIEPKYRLRMQMSNDVRMLLPTLVGIMVAKVRASALTPHSTCLLLDCCGRKRKETVCLGCRAAYRLPRSTRFQHDPARSGSATRRRTRCTTGSWR